MKRNLLPLLGIAFVVALAASGIFYGVFVGQLKQASRSAALQQIVVAARTLDRGTVLKASDLKLSPWAGAVLPGSHPKINEAVVGKTLYASLQENEPITDLRLSAEKAGGGLSVARGMRALSIKVVDSSGLTQFLRAGHRIDVQVVQGRNNAEAALRTILQNVEVLGVQVPEGNQAQFGPATVTVLATPEDSDRLALADSGASIRILLRNPLDDEKEPRPSMALASLFHAGPRLAPQPVRPLAIRAAAATESREERIDVVVRVASLSVAGMQELRAAMPALGAIDSMQVTPLPRSESMDRLWAGSQDLASSRVTASTLQAGYARPGRQWVAAPGGACGLNIRLQQIRLPGRFLRLRIQPEVTVPAGAAAVSTRRAVAEVELSEGQGAIVTGLADPSAAPSLAELLFGRPGLSELVVILTPRAAGSKTALAMGRP